MNLKTSIILLSSILLSSVIITVGIYFLNFKTSSISNDPENWAQFGDYFGSIINSILGILNLFVLTYLTVKIVTVEDERNRWTLQELARPYGYLEFNSDFEILEINLNNCGLGPMIVTNIMIKKNNGEEYSNFYDVLKNFIIDSNVNPKIYTYHAGATSGAIAKDKSTFLVKIIYNLEDDLQDFKQFRSDCEDFLNDFIIEIQYEDMYSRKMQDLKEQIDFPKL